MGSKELIKRGCFLSSDEAALEYKKRRKEKMFMSISQGDSIPEGWTVENKLKTKIHLSKEKRTGKKLEDKVWCLFYEIGIRQMSSDGFTMVLRNQGGLEKTKQLDIVAVDGDIVFVVECKSREVNVKTSLKKEIAEIAQYRKRAIEAIKKSLGVEKIHVKFMLATENIIVDENDVLDAKENNILIWDEYYFLCLQELASVAGEGAKYQVYTRLFFNEKIRNFDIKIPALKSKMGGYTYYMFNMTPDYLLRIAYVHHRTKDSSFMDIADSYQRIINPTRVQKITSYIEGGGFFPGSIIVNFNRSFLKEELLGSKKNDLKNVENFSSPVIITLPPYYGSAWVIDGQHRLYGYADSPLKTSETIPVVAFVKESNKMQTKVFVDINGEQQAIQSSLLYDLYEDLFEGSQDAKEQELWMISKIVKELNKRDDSPFKNSISIPKDKNKGPISMATFFLSIKQLRLVNKKEKLLIQTTLIETIEYVVNRLIIFYDIIRTKRKAEWEKENAHFFKTNAGVAVLNGIFRDTVAKMEHRQRDDVKIFRNTVSKILNELLEYFSCISADKIAGYRSKGAVGQHVREVRAVLTEVIQNKNGFHSEWLDAYKKVKESKALVNHKIKDLLNKEECEQLEFKGSMELALIPFLQKGNKHNDKNLSKGLLESIVAFLNGKGGEIIIGVLEQNKIEKYLNNYEDFISVEEKIVLGIKEEYTKEGWDGYHIKLMQLISDNINDVAITNEFVNIRRESFKGKDLCVVTVSPFGEEDYFLKDEDFYVRRGATNKLLKGIALSKHLEYRKKTRKSI